MDQAFYNTLLEYHKTNKLPENIEILARSSKYRFLQKAKLYSIKGNHLVDSNGIKVVPESEANKVIEQTWSKIPTGELTIYNQLRGTKITKNQIHQFVSKQEVTQLHKPIPSKVSVKRIVAPTPGVWLQADLIDMSAYSYFNLNYNWILTAIDVNNKFGWAIPLKNKTANEVADGLESILKDNKFKLLHTDNGSEFKNAILDSVCTKYNVKQIYGTPYHPQSQGLVERFNKTLKTWIFKHFTMYNTKVWKDILSDLVKTYNTSVTHYKSKKETVISKVLPKLEIGDWVRISNRTKKSYRKIAIFQKQYYPNWSKNIYTVIQSIKIPNVVGDQYQYKLKSETGKIKKKVYLRPDLQLIPKDTVTVKRERPIYDSKFFNREIHLQSLASAPVVENKIPKPVTLLESRATHKRVIKKPVRYED
jgi:hypothetical protein